MIQQLRFFFYRGVVMLIYGALALVGLAVVLMLVRFGVRAIIAYRDKRRTAQKARNPVRPVRTWLIIGLSVLIGVLLWRGQLIAALSSLPALLVFFIRWLPLWQMARSFFLFKRGGAGAGYTGAQGRAGAGSRAMSFDEALDMLGLRGVEPLNAAVINKAYKDLMQRVHPDHGGSSGLAARLNEARALLLQRYR